MSHESLLVVSTRGESIGKVIHYDGDQTFLVERGTVFPQDFQFHYESITGVSEDGALVYMVTEFDEEPPSTAQDPAVGVEDGHDQPGD